MRILAWTEKDVQGLSARGLSEILTEVDGDGSIVREIGLAEGEVVYAVSALAPEGSFRGMFDLQTVDESSRTGRDEVPRELFEAYWARRPREARLPRART